LKPMARHLRLRLRLFLLIFPHGNVTSWQRLAIQRAAVKVPCCARRHSVRAKRRVRATSSHGLSDATVMLNLLFPSGVGRQQEPTFVPGPSPSPAQSDGFSLTSRAGTRFIMPSRGCGCTDLFPAGPGGGGGAAFALDAACPQSPPAAAVGTKRPNSAAAGCPAVTDSPGGSTAKPDTSGGMWQ
jgi:hypothetical protein